MRRVSVGVLSAAVSGLALSQASAKAPRKPAPPPPLPQASRWSGFYVGGHLGGGWQGSDSLTVTDFTGQGFFSPTTFGNSAQGRFLGGAQVGYNWQFASRWVVGIEGDWTGANLRESVGSSLGPAGYISTLRSTRSVNSLMSVRGRIGYAADSMLYYFTAGGAWGWTSYSAVTVVPPGGGGGVALPTAFNNTSQGYVLGGGLEYALDAAWSVRAEYLYYRLGGASSNAFGPVPIPPGAFFNYSWSASQVNVVRVGVDYKFGL